LPSYGNMSGQAPVQIPKQVYDGQSKVVPPYMGNSSHKVQLAQSDSSPGDGLPPLTAGPPAPSGGGGIPPTQPTSISSISIPPSPSRPPGDSSYLEHPQQEKLQEIAVETKQPIVPPSEV